MNDIYVYEHKNGKQFTLPLNPIAYSVYCDREKFEKPKAIGRWRYKQIKTPVKM